MGTVTDPVPVTGLAANLSPSPRIAPPPFGRLICGATAAGPAAGARVLSADGSDDGLAITSLQADGIGIGPYPAGFPQTFLQLARAKSAPDEVFECRTKSNPGFLVGEPRFRGVYT